MYELAKTGLTEVELIAIGVGIVLLCCCCCCLCVYCRWRRNKKKKGGPATSRGKRFTKAEAAKRDLLARTTTNPKFDSIATIGGGVRPMGGLACGADRVSVPIRQSGGQPYGQQYGQQYDYNPGNTDMPPPPPPPPGGRHHPGVAPLGMRKVDSVWNPPTDLLPPGWEECEDDEGTVFFYNEGTGESRWDRPTAARWSGRL